MARLKYNLSASRDYVRAEQECIGTTTVGIPIIAHGDGAGFVSIDGVRFIDFTSQIGLCSTGYSPPHIVVPVKHQMDMLHACIPADWPYEFEVTAHDGATLKVSRLALAQELARIVSPFIENARMYFETSGALAVELACKIISHNSTPTKHLEDFASFEEDSLATNLYPAFHTKYRVGIIGFERAFHGRHGRAQFATNSKPQHYVGGSSSASYHRIPFPVPGTDRDELLARARMALRHARAWSSCVSFIMEPVQGEGGINVPDGRLLKEIVTYFKSENVSIIDDEIQAGMGRTGRMFAIEHFDLQGLVDVIILGKALSGGLPLSVVITDKNRLKDLTTGVHSGSFHSEPCAVTAALANLQFMEQRNLVARSAGLGGHLKYLLGTELKKFTSVVPNNGTPIREIRGLGMMLGIEFHQPADAHFVVERAIEYGLLTATAGRYGEVIRILPPLTIPIDEMEMGVKILCNSVHDLVTN